jgi:anthranilate phosphoribosyltransferase
VIEVKDGATEEWFAAPEDFGIPVAGLEGVAGGSPAENAAAVRSVFDGEPGPRRDFVLLNAGAAIYVGGKVSDLEKGIAGAAEAIDSGGAAEMLDRLIETTRRLGADPGR